MGYVIQAVYEKGVLRPLEKLNLSEHQQVWVTVEPAGAGDQEPQDLDGSDPLDGLRSAMGVPDLAEHFDDYRFGRREP